MDAKIIEAYKPVNVGSFLVLAFIQNFFNALWQEIIFRGYLQTRLVKVYGVIWGILLNTIIFVLLHRFIRPMSVIEIFTGIVIFSFVGFLFHKSKSIFLVTGMHGTGNFLLAIFARSDIPRPKHLDLLLVFGIISLIVYTVSKTATKLAIIKRNERE